MPFTYAPLLLADRWEDYRLLDCGDGMKQERWGGHVLVRPDPQVIWPRRDRAPWTGWDGYYHRSDTGGGRWEFLRPLPESWTIGYAPLGLTFRIRPTGFKHTGLFPEQAVNWEWAAGLIRGARERGREVGVLNLFGYTGAATVAAARAGAAVCHVDAAKGMVEWCRENAALSGVSGNPIRYIVDDCRKFVQREARRGRRYDAIVMDPPTYGRGGAGEMWKIEDDLWGLLEDCRNVLSDRPLFLLINSYTARLSPVVAANLLDSLLSGAGGVVSAGEIGLPVQRDGHVLPCGIFGRWEAAAG